MVTFLTRKGAEIFAANRKRGFRRIAKIEVDPKRKKFLLESVKTIKIRRLKGRPLLFEVIGR